MSVMDLILGGNADGELDEIIEAVRQRRQVLARRAAKQFAEGDRVVVVDNVSPKYLIGATGVVVNQRSDKTVNVRLDQQHGRYKGVIGFHAMTIRKIEEEV